MNNPIITILDELDSIINKMIDEKNKSDEQFQKQISYLQNKYENDIRKIDMLIDVYKKKHSTFRKYGKYGNSI